jgi:hypothetical protein
VASNVVQESAVREPTIGSKQSLVFALWQVEILP